MNDIFHILDHWCYGTYFSQLWLGKSVYTKKKKKKKIFFLNLYSKTQTKTDLSYWFLLISFVVIKVRNRMDKVGKAELAKPMALTGCYLLLVNLVKRVLIKLKFCHFPPPYFTGLKDSDQCKNINPNMNHSFYFVMDQNQREYY